MIKITHLEGYAGLRLKDGKSLEVKKGINLLVGRNGSGKSNLAELIHFIFNDEGAKNGKHLFETKYLEGIAKKAIQNFEIRLN
jgi:recombinational DNA repair ATPase RecF